MTKIKNDILHFLSIVTICLQFFMAPLAVYGADNETPNMDKYEKQYADDTYILGLIKSCDDINGTWNVSTNKCKANEADADNAAKAEACAEIEDTAERNKCFEDLGKETAGLGEGSDVAMTTAELEKDAAKAAEQMKWWGVVQLVMSAITGGANSDCMSMQISSKVGLANSLVSLGIYFFMDDETEALREEYEKSITDTAYDAQTGAYEFLKKEQEAAKEVAERDEMIHKFTAYGYTAASIMAIAEGLVPATAAKGCRTTVNDLQALAHFERYGEFGGKKMTKEEFDDASIGDGHVDADGNKYTIKDNKLHMDSKDGSLNSIANADGTDVTITKFEMTADGKRVQLGEDPKVDKVEIQHNQKYTLTEDHKRVASEASSTTYDYNEKSGQITASETNGVRYGQTADGKGTYVSSEFSDNKTFYETEAHNVKTSRNTEVFKNEGGDKLSYTEKGQNFDTHGNYTSGYEGGGTLPSPGTNYRVEMSADMKGVDGKVDFSSRPQNVAVYRNYDNATKNFDPETGLLKDQTATPVATFDKVATSYDPANPDSSLNKMELTGGQEGSSATVNKLGGQNVGVDLSSKEASMTIDITAEGDVSMSGSNVKVTGGDTSSIGAEGEAGDYSYSRKATVIEETKPGTGEVSKIRTDATTESGSFTTNKKTAPFDPEGKVTAAQKKYDEASKSLGQKKYDGASATEIATAEADLATAKEELATTTKKAHTAQNKTVVGKSSEFTNQYDKNGDFVSSDHTTSEIESGGATNSRQNVDINNPDGSREHIYKVSSTTDGANDVSYKSATTINSKGEKIEVANVNPMGGDTHSGAVVTRVTKADGSYQETWEQGGVTTVETYNADGTKLATASTEEFSVETQADINKNAPQIPDTTPVQTGQNLVDDTRQVTNQDEINVYTSKLKTQEISNSTRAKFAPAEISDGSVKTTPKGVKVVSVTQANKGDFNVQINETPNLTTEQLARAESFVASGALNDTQAVGFTQDGRMVVVQNTSGAGGFVANNVTGSGESFQVGSVSVDGSKAVVTGGTMSSVGNSDLSNVGINTVNERLASFSQADTSAIPKVEPIYVQVEVPPTAYPTDIDVSTIPDPLSPELLNPKVDISNPDYWNAAYENIKNETERFEPTRREERRDDTSQIKFEDLLRDNHFNMPAVELQDGYVERLEAQMRDISNDTDAMFVFKEIHSFYSNSSGHSPLLSDYKYAKANGSFEISEVNDDFEFKYFLVEMSKITKRSYNALIPKVHAKESTGDKAGNVIYGGNDQKMDADTLMFGGGMIGGALRGAGMALLMKTMLPGVKQTLMPYLSHPYGIAAINGINAGFQYKLASHSKKQVDLCDKRIALIDDALSKFGTLNQRYCLDGRDNIGKPECYCYNDDGTKNNSHSNSDTCQAYWAAGGTGLTFRDAGSYGSKSEVANACVTVNGHYDANCKCKAYKDKKSGTNACMKATSATRNFISLGKAAGLSGINTVLDQTFSGNTNGMADFNNTQGPQLAARQAKIKKKLEDKYNRLLISKGKKPLPPASAGESIMRGMLKKVKLPSGLSGKLGSMQPNKRLSSVAQSALNKAIGKTGVKSVYSKSKGARKAGKKKGSEFDFGIGDGTSGGQKLNTSKFMDKKYKYKANDIVKNKGVSIFKVISARYQQTAMERLFPDEE